MCSLQTVYMWRSVHGVQRGAYSQQQLENQHFSAGTGRRRPALSRLLVGAHRVDVFKGQILPGGEDGYHDEEFAAPKHLTGKLWEAFGSQRALPLLIKNTK